MSSSINTYNFSPWQKKKKKSFLFLLFFLCPVYCYLFLFFHSLSFLFFLMLSLIFFLFIFIQFPFCFSSFVFFHLSPSLSFYSFPYSFLPFFLNLSLISFSLLSFNLFINFFFVLTPSFIFFPFHSISFSFIFILMPSFISDFFSFILFFVSLLHCYTSVHAFLFIFIQSLRFSSFLCHYLSSLLIHSLFSFFFSVSIYCLLLSIPSLSFSFHFFIVVPLFTPFSLSSVWFSFLFFLCLRLCPCLSLYSIDSFLSDVSFYLFFIHSLFLFFPSFSSSPSVLHPDHLLFSNPQLLQPLVSFFFVRRWFNEPHMAHLIHFPTCILTV